MPMLTASGRAFDPKCLAAMKRVLDVPQDTPGVHVRMG